MDRDDDLVVVICMTVAQMPRPYTSSVVRPCDACGVRVWLGVETLAEVQAIHPDLRVRPLCSWCGEALREQFRGTAEMTPQQQALFGSDADAVMEEAERWLKEQRRGPRT